MSSKLKFAAYTFGPDSGVLFGEFFYNFGKIYLTDSVLVERQNDQCRRSKDQRSLHL